MSNDQPHIKIEIRSNANFLAGTREMLSGIAKRLGFSDESAGHIALALDEALCNVIRHGYDKAPDKPIWISVFAIGGVATPDQHASPTSALKIVIDDEARQVDLATIKSRDLDEVRPGGLGVHIIHEVMDEVHYEHRKPKGMRLIMIKNRSSGKRVGPETPGQGDRSCSCGDHS